MTLTSFGADLTELDNPTPRDTPATRDLLRKLYTAKEAEHATRSRYDGLVDGPEKNEAHAEWLCCFFDTEACRRQVRDSRAWATTEEVDAQSWAMQISDMRIGG